MLKQRRRPYWLRKTFSGGSIGQNPYWKKCELRYQKLGVGKSKDHIHWRKTFFTRWVWPDGIGVEVEKCERFTVSFSRGSMVWAGIGFNWRTSIHFSEGKVFSEYYQYLIEESYMLFRQPGCFNSLLHEYWKPPKNVIWSFQLAGSRPFSRMVMQVFQIWNLNIHFWDVT